MAKDSGPVAGTEPMDMIDMSGASCFIALQLVQSGEITWIAVRLFALG